MQRHELTDTLAQLHDELSQREDVDPDTLELLTKLTSDIDRLLKKPSPALSAEAAPVSLGLKDLLLKFEAEYPQLSTTVGKVADALAAIGI